DEAEAPPVNRLDGAEYVGLPDESTPAASRLDPATVGVKSVVVVESEAPAKGKEADLAPDTPPESESEPAAVASEPVRRSLSARVDLAELWEQECRSARRKLEPDGALTGATRELQGGLGTFLEVCHEHGVKV